MAVTTKTIPLKLAERIIVRSPVSPFRFNSSTADILPLLEDDSFLEAIYIASPALYDECIKLKSGLINTEKDRAKIIGSLYRYYTRMYTRSTPFGLFSTCTVVDWGDGNPDADLGELERHTRLDMEFLQTLVLVLTQITYIKEVLHYHTNSSVYISGAEIRYIEHTFVKTIKKYKISAVTKNGYILKVLEFAKNGLSYADLVKLITDEGIAQADAVGLIENLIQSQLLVSEFEAKVTGEEDFAFQIVAHLEEIYKRSQSWYIQSILNFFKSVLHELQAFDTNKANPIGAYKSIISRLKFLQPRIDEARLFHIDAYRSGSKSHTVRESVKDEIIEAMQYFMQLNEGMLVLNRNLENFKAKFQERYDSQSVALAEVLDTDLGIGYPVNRSVSSAVMVDDIPLGQRETGTQIQLNIVEKWLFEMLKDPDNSQAYSIDLDKQPYPSFFNKDGQTNWANMPKSMSVIFRIVNDEAQTLFIEGHYGVSACSVIARFTYGNEDIRKVTESIIEEEEKATENAILAEVVHMPDNRVTNVIMHPPLRKFEIPYLAKPVAVGGDIIEINDLFVKVENNEIVLFSKKMNKRILPRKTHMHNHTVNSLPVYNFLADLQDQGSNRSLTFYGAELLRLFVFIPRFYYKKTIISPATWSFSEGMLSMLKGDDANVVNEKLNKFRQQYRIPRFVLYAENDNDLLVDFDDPASVLIWLNLIKTKPTAMLKELLYFEKADSNAYFNQYVASLICTEKQVFNQPVSNAVLKEQGNVQRHFNPGSDWLYLKLYCGIGSQDIVLNKLLLQVMKNILQQGLIHKWFYIRYYDTDSHIRLRIHLKRAEDAHRVLATLNEAIAQMPEKLLMWKMLPDNYVREIERYGANTIEHCESLFFIDSMVSAEMPGVLGLGNNGKQLFLWCMKMVDNLLNAFQLTLEEKIAFVDMTRKAYQVEFGANKNTNDAINAKYNDSKAEIADIMAGPSEANAKNKTMNFLLQQKSALQAPVISEIIKIKNEGRLMVGFDTLLSSLIHMMLNRIIVSKERLHEFLLYEFIVKYYRMVLFTEKKRISADV
jgi:lantibiotic biosynthesis protein